MKLLPTATAQLCQQSKMYDPSNPTFARDRRTNAGLLSVLHLDAFRAHLSADELNKLRLLNHRALFAVDSTAAEAYLSLPADTGASEYLSGPESAAQTHQRAPMLHKLHVFFVEGQAQAIVPGKKAQVQPTKQNYKALDAGRFWQRYLRAWGNGAFSPRFDPALPERLACVTQLQLVVPSTPLDTAVHGVWEDLFNMMPNMTSLDLSATPPAAPKPGIPSSSHVHVLSTECVALICRLPALHTFRLRRVRVPAPAFTSLLSGLRRLRCLSLDQPLDVPSSMHAAALACHALQLTTLAHSSMQLELKQQQPRLVAVPRPETVYSSSSSSSSMSALGESSIGMDSPTRHVSTVAAAYPPLHAAAEMATPLPATPAAGSSRATVAVSSDPWVGPVWQPSLERGAGLLVVRKLLETLPSLTGLAGVQLRVNAMLGWAPEQRHALRDITQRFAGCADSWALSFIRMDVIHVDEEGQPVWASELLPAALPAVRNVALHAAGCVSEAFRLRTAHECARIATACPHAVRLCLVAESAADMDWLHELLKVMLAAMPQLTDVYVLCEAARLTMHEWLLRYGKKHAEYKMLRDAAEAAAHARICMGRVQHSHASIPASMQQLLAAEHHAQMLAQDASQALFDAWHSPAHRLLAELPKVCSRLALCAAAEGRSAVRMHGVGYTAEVAAHLDTWAQQWEAPPSRA